MNDFFNGMFGKIQPGLCRFSYGGKIAIKTSSGYKTYDVKKNRLVNCSTLAFDFGDNLFFVIPTNKVESGDIVLINGKPNAVISREGTTIKVFNYETSAIQEIVPERHIFMGNEYFYGKIVSMFSGKLGSKNMMKYMVLSQMMNGKGGDMNSMMPMMFMMNGEMGGMFNEMFSLDESAEEESVTDEGEEQ